MANADPEMFRLLEIALQQLAGPHPGAPPSALPLSALDEDFTEINVMLLAASVLVVWSVPNCRSLPGLDGAPVCVDARRPPVR